jgi:uncharacterized protein YoaH (UPF0181 family)
MDERIENLVTQGVPMIEAIKLIQEIDSDG